jgi:putative transposase
MGDKNMNERSEFQPHHRRSIRLKDYDYASVNGYFVTVCTHNRECLLGEVVDGKIRLNEYGEIAKDEWLKTASVRPNVVLDTFIIMPNHFHGIIIFAENVGATRRAALPEGWRNVPAHRPKGPQSASIGVIIGQFKSAVTKRINAQRDTPGLPIWQRNYYERVLREGELEHVREYIQNNPIQWEIDSENPARHT